MAASYPTPLHPTTRFIQSQVSKIYWLTTIASTSTHIPTRSEMTAGTDLTNEIMGLTGFSSSANQVDAGDLGHRFIPTLPGKIKTPASTIDFYADQTGNDVRGTFSIDTAGYLLFLDTGDFGTASKMDIFTATCASVQVVRDAGDNPLKVTVSFALPAQPVYGATVPANP
jgi:hypothetical protein